ncbi:MAG: hypothetical protein WCO98_09990 [bacterium]
MANTATAFKLDADIQEQVQEQLILTPTHNQQVRPSAFVQFLEKKWPVSILVLLLCVGLQSFCHVIIANQDYQRQRTSRQLAQLEADKRHNMLILDKLATKPRMIKMAQVIGLAQPSTDRLHIIKSASTGPARQIAKEKSTKSAWAKSGSMWAAVFKRIGHGPGVATLND